MSSNGRPRLQVEMWMERGEFEVAASLMLKRLAHSTGFPNQSRAVDVLCTSNRFHFRLFLANEEGWRNSWQCVHMH
jgi:hypothetical protein